jgi:hypothetical protein
VEFIIERPGKTEWRCCRVRFRRFYISFILLSSSLCIISPMGNLALFNSFFLVPYLLVLLSTAPHPSVPKSRARTTTQTLRIDHASGLEISCLFCTLAYAFHSHQHMKQLCIVYPTGRFDPWFFCFGRFLGTSSF